MTKHTIYFHSALWKLTGNTKQCTIEGDSYLDLVRNCINLFPELRKAIPRLQKQSQQAGEELWIVVGNELISMERLFMPPSSKKKIYLVPVLYGNNKIGMIIIGIILVVAIIALTIFTGGAALAAAGAAGGAAAGSLGAAAGAGASALAVGAIGAEAAALGATAATAGLTFMEVAQLVSLALSVISTILRIALAPKRNVSDGAYRKDNDAFGSLENKTAVNSAIPLNYGLVRVPGQFINGYIKTINHDKNDIIKVSSYI